MDKGFNFENSVIVVEAQGIGKWDEQKGYSHLTFKSPESHNRPIIETKDLTFIISNKVAAHTNWMVWDEQNNIIAAPDKQRLEYFFKFAKICLDQIAKDIQGNQPENADVNSVTA